jgi:hypothetical protein
MLRADVGEYVVPEVGLEPTRPFEQQILSLSCIPISPLRLGAYSNLVERRRERSNDLISTI